MVRSARAFKTALFYVVISLIALVMILPFLWMISTSLKEAEAVMVLPIRWIPEKISLKAYRDLFTISTIIPFHRATLNSLIVSLLTTFVTLTSSSMAAFALAKFDFRRRDQILMLFVATMMVPQAVTMIPNYLVLRTLRLPNTFIGLVLPMIYNAWALFLLRQNIMAIPEPYFEAAIVDGAGPFTIYRHVVLPLAKPIIASLAVITFMGTWNDYLWPLIMISDPNKATLTLALGNLNSRWGQHWELLMAGDLVSMLPVVLVYILGQKYFESGISVGGLKS
ncbi:MAG: carbohydrate ABC transporter permease [Clostridia bacterium]|nr:carbohydrate ABC transporter permease [Clostridia bacterium]